MSALIVEPPFEIFTDIDGQPLEAGYVWIGTANLDPQVNPITVYFDQALTILAAQPLRTIGGYIVNSGTPAKIYVDAAAYSIRVMNKNGSTLYTLPNGTGINPNACGVEYDPPFIGGVPYPVCEKLAQTVSVKDFGAVGNGVANDTAALQNAFNTTNTYINDGTYNSTGLNLGSNSVITSDPRSLIYHTSNSGSGINADTSTNINVSGFTVDMGYSRGLTNASHGMRFRGSNVTVSDVTITDFAFNGVSGGGTGALFFPDTSNRLSGIRLKDSNFVADPTGNEAFGFIFDTTDTSFATNIYAKNVIGNAVGTGYAHELKNDARHNFLGGLIAENSSVAVGFGQQTPGDDGADRNLIMGVVSKSTDVGWLVGEGDDNLLVGMNYDSEGRPESAPVVGVNLSTDANNNAAYAVKLRSSQTYGTTIAAERNFVQLCAQSANTSQIARFGVDAKTNVVEVSHAGGRNTLEGFVQDFSGQGRRGFFANVTYSMALGQQLGSISGTFYRSLGDGTTTWNSLHYFRDESDVNAIHAYGTPDTSGSIVGIQHSVPGNSNVAGFWHQIGASVSANFWSLRGWTGGGSRYVWEETTYRAAADNVYDLGTSARRWREIFAGNAVINTSDERLKTEIRDLTEAERAVALRLKSCIKAFKWRDAVEQKGGKARIHFGVIAQQVVAAFEAEGLDPFAYGLVCFDKWEETPEQVGQDGEVLVAHNPAGNRYGVRYEELLAFIIGAL